MLLRLLIVDDDTSLCSSLKSFFERNKYRVETAHDGPGAMKAVEKFHPNLMFLDIGLPGISGIEILKKVKEKDPSVRVIMITGQTEDELMRQARVLGADDYVTKPFTLEYLSGEVLDKLHKQLFYELRSASADLAIEREKVEVLFDQAADGVIMFNPQGSIFVANPVARSLLGLSGDLNAITAEKAFENFKGEVLAVSFDDLSKLVDQSFDLVREEPKKLILNFRFNPIHSRKQELFGYLAILRDVTQERRAENAMHRFISMVSHKLRTPLVAIRGYPPLLLTPNAAHPLDSFQRTAVETILRECLRMERLVNELIAFSSLEPQEISKQPVKVSELVREAEKILPEEYQKFKGKVNVSGVSDALMVDADPTLLQHAFRNIIENAFKFGATQLDVLGKRDGDMVAIQFTDDGPGIPPEDRERVFERFYQVDKHFVGQIPGAGLGLTMVKETVQAHGGKIWVDKGNGKGSTFFIKLPAAVPVKGS
jgi:signal transduction histidine kinase